MSQRPGKRSEAHRQSVTIAYSGMAAALSVVLLLTGSLIPIMTYVSPLAAGLLLLPVMAEFGKKYAWICYAASALIVLMLGVDREAAFFYLFFGYYPIIKWQLDKVRSKGLCLLIKSAFFALSGAAMYAIMAFLLHMDALMAEFGEMGAAMTVVFFLMMLLCLHLYDRLLFPMLVVYDRKLKPKLRIR